MNENTEMEISVGQLNGYKMVYDNNGNTYQNMRLLNTNIMNLIGGQYFKLSIFPPHMLENCISLYGRMTGNYVIREGCLKNLKDIIGSPVIRIVDTYDSVAYALDSCVNLAPSIRLPAMISPHDVQVQLSNLRNMSHVFNGVANATSLNTLFGGVVPSTASGGYSFLVNTVHAFGGAYGNFSSSPLLNPEQLWMDMFPIIKDASYAFAGVQAAKYFDGDYIEYFLKTHLGNANNIAGMLKDTPIHSRNIDDIRVMLNNTMNSILWNDGGRTNYYQSDYNGNIFSYSWLYNYSQYYMCDEMNYLLDAHEFMNGCQNYDGPAVILTGYASIYGSGSGGNDGVDWSNAYRNCRFITHSPYIKEFAYSSYHYYSGKMAGTFADCPNMRGTVYLNRSDASGFNYNLAGTFENDSYLNVFINGDITNAYRILRGAHDMVLYIDVPNAFNNVRNEALNSCDLDVESYGNVPQTNWNLNFGFYDFRTNSWLYNTIPNARYYTRFTNNVVVYCSSTSVAPLDEGVPYLNHFEVDPNSHDFLIRRIYIG